MLHATCAEVCGMPRVSRAWRFMSPNARRCVAFSTLSTACMLRLRHTTCQIRRLLVRSGAQALSATALRLASAAADASSPGADVANPGADVVQTTGDDAIHSNVDAAAR